MERGIAVAKILLVGTDTSLLEGLSQTLAAAGQTTTIAETISEALATPSSEPALIALVEREALAGAASRLPLAPGGALILYRTAQSTPMSALPPMLQRAVLADLLLPLERQRLISLIQTVEARAQTTGRSRHSALEEERADV